MGVWNVVVVVRERRYGWVCGREGPGGTNGEFGKVEVEVKVQVKVKKTSKSKSKIKGQQHRNFIIASYKAA